MSSYDEKRTWAEIYTCNLLHNYHALRASAPAGTRFLGVVKANAYGHGALQVASLLEKEGADYLAVACLDEAIALREGGITMPILILGHTPAEYTDLLVRHGITQAVYDLEKAEDFSRRAMALGQPLKAHIKLDTGMSRIGFICSGTHLDSAVADVSRAVTLPGLDVEGVFTHFAVSDEPDSEASREYTRAQFRLFTSVIQAVEEKTGFSFRIRHCANTGAVAYWPEFALDMIRPGLLLYGYGDDTGRLGLRPCMGLFTRICTVRGLDCGTSISYGRRYTTDRDEKIAVLGIGYADGLHRAVSNQLSFLVEGKTAPQRGRICMDMCMIDVTEIPEAHEGSIVEIFGEHHSIQAYCEAAQTISYELLCAVSPRVPRIYR